MPRQLDTRIAEILRNYGEDPTDTRGVIWDCHGTWVVYHKALERVAARAGISFDAPNVLRAERDEAVILCTARMGDRVDWDIGEALIGVNYRVSGKQAAYVYAMALKRGRDRLILKLTGLHGLLYSEEEADDFRQQAQQPIERPVGHTHGQSAEPTASQLMARDMAARLWKVRGEEAVKLVTSDPAFRQQFRDLDEADRERIGNLVTERRQA